MNERRPMKMNKAIKGYKNTTWIGEMVDRLENGGVNFKNTYTKLQRVKGFLKEDKKKLEKVENAKRLI